jgi:hypothetical protein
VHVITPIAVRPQGSKTRHPGIIRDAKALGVSASHLWHVLEHRRPSVRLLAKYQSLKKLQGEKRCPSTSQTTSE